MKMAEMAGTAFTVIVVVPTMPAAHIREAPDFRPARSGDVGARVEQAAPVARIDQGARAVSGLPGRAT